MNLPYETEWKDHISEDGWKFKMLYTESTILQVETVDGEVYTTHAPAIKVIFEDRSESDWVYPPKGSYFLHGTGE
ncbi:hypothetical protein VPBG_00197 [Vibrio phage helene 12B3]|uniref:hypothetical protein n=1 Tax=Vibrio phage helene 12B3 TaxID=573173 RepID=UPI0002C08F8B|nr:hypothetical protein VPBG_00197 [Vibrio phage helene 12B3]YP_009223066.1 hypothetical protein VPLG_00217 [Vibrio phage eugene 12A10]AGG57969.1 hypothetical protein VPBG_00197 [Vibrio phage helene 12B3]AGN51656.1 hypothetical protein VPLG_00217 [Vibrio phage eugene 12A10]